MSALPLRIWQPPQPKYKVGCPMVTPDRQLLAACGQWMSDDPVDWQTGGFLVRSALETFLRLRCGKLGLPIGQRRKLDRLLYEAGAITMDDYRECQRLFDRGAAAVHNRPFLAADCEELYHDVREFVAEV